MSVLSQKHFHDEKAAYAFVEERVWPNGPICPHCGGVERIGKMGGKSTRIGTYKCYQCRKPFTVKIGTIFESSHVKMHLWLQAIFLMASSKKGISANQLHRTLGVTLKTSWFMAHRIREAMREGGKTGPSHKRAILGLIERGGSVRTFHIKQATKVNVAELVTSNVDRESVLYTDESRLYSGMNTHFADRQSVKHRSGEYARGGVHSNTIESYFSIFKRGMRGTYQHCKEKHLHRYLAEFDFRHNRRVAVGCDDEGRAENILTGAIGKRLTYETAVER